MSWRERLQCAGPMPSDRSDQSPTSVTSVTTSTDSQYASVVAEQQTPALRTSSKAPQIRELKQPAQDALLKARREIAAPLAAAYGRQQGVGRVPENHADTEPLQGLALSSAASVHGVIP